MITHFDVTIDVYGEKFDVLVIHSRKTVWTATGDYKGKKITVPGRSRAAAEKAWQHSAEMRARQ